MIADCGTRLYGELWYHGNIGRIDANARLSRHGAGAFLVRSKAQPGEAVEVQHVLSLKVERPRGDDGEAVVHFLITRVQPDPIDDDAYAYATSPAAGMYSLVGKPCVKRPTVQALIEAYATTPPANRLGTLLTTPCPCPCTAPCASTYAGAAGAEAVDSLLEEEAEDPYTDLFSVAADPDVLASVRALAIKRHSDVADISLREANRLRSLSDTGTPPTPPTVAPRFDAGVTPPLSPQPRPLPSADYPPAASEPAVVNHHAHLPSSPSPRRSSPTSRASPGPRTNNQGALHSDRSGGATSGDGNRGSHRASGKYFYANSTDVARRRSAASSGRSNVPPDTAAKPNARRVTCI